MCTGLERPRPGADHSTQSSGDMKNEWSCISTHAAMLLVTEPTMVVLALKDAQSVM